MFLTLIEKDLPWTSEYIDLFNNEQYRPEYLKLNPKSVVPTLIHDGRAIIESTLVCEYLDQTFPEPSLVPASAYERSQMRRWSKHIDERVFEACSAKATHVEVSKSEGAGRESIAMVRRQTCG